MSSQRDQELAVDHARAGARQHLAEVGLRPDGAEHARARPTTATGLLRIGAVALGREAQSIAFFSCPGIDELYSGVANRTRVGAGDRVVELDDARRRLFAFVVLVERRHRLQAVPQLDVDAGRRQLGRARGAASC